MRWLLAVSPLLLLLAPLKQLLEGRMSLHMLIEFPWLLAGGAAAFGLCPERCQLTRLLARLDERGLLTVMLVLCVSTFWMIPSALDLALLDGRVAFAKYLSWYVTGLMLASGSPRIATELWAFLLGNLAWMMATAGWLIRESETRVCVSYLVRDQFWAGTGLIVFALGLSTWGLSCWQRMESGLSPPVPSTDGH
jgi:hypothetical protein